jgi:hypothetical protein
MSFIPSTITLWNKLNIDIRNMQTVVGFKKKLKKIHFKVPNKLYLYSTSHGAINLSRICMGPSGLNQQRRKYNFIENGRCSTCNFIIFFNVPRLPPRYQLYIVRYARYFHQQLIQTYYSSKVSWRKDNF